MLFLPNLCKGSLQLLKLNYTLDSQTFLKTYVIFLSQCSYRSKYTFTPQTRYTQNSQYSSNLPINTSNLRYPSLSILHTVHLLSPMSIAPYSSSEIQHAILALIKQINKNLKIITHCTFMQETINSLVNIILFKFVSEIIQYIKQMIVCVVVHLKVQVLLIH